MPTYRSFSPDGTDDTLNTFSNDSDFNITTGDFTISFWLNSTHFADERIIFAKGAAGASGHYLEHFNSKLYYTVCGVGGCSTTFTLPSGSWVHVTLVKSGTTYYFYKNAGSKENYVIGNINSTASTLVFTQTWTGLNGLLGGITLIRFYNRALSDAEVLALYNLTGESSTGLVAYWKCQDSAGTTMTDELALHNGVLGSITPATFFSTDGPAMPAGSDWISTKGQADWLNITSALRQSSHEVYRRIWFKRRTSSGYEADWQQVPQERIISYGKITRTADKVYPSEIQNDQINIELDNNDGYYNNPIGAPLDSIYNNFFQGYVSRYKTLVKIEYGYIYNGVEIPGQYNFTIGIIGEKAENKENGNVEILIEPAETVLKNYEASNFSSINVTYPQNVYDLILKQTDSSGNNIFEDMWSMGSRRCSIPRALIDVTDASLEGKSSWDLLTNAGECSQALLSTYGNNIYLNDNETDIFYDDVTTTLSSINSIYPNNNCIFHASFNNAISTINSSEIGPNYAWGRTGESGIGTITNVKFGNGVMGNSATSYIRVTIPTSLLRTYNKFTAEMWIKPFFNTSTGVSSLRAPIFESPNEMTFGWVEDLEHDAKNRLGFLKIDQFGTANSYFCFASDSYCTITSGQVYFVAVVYDHLGIEGSNDICRIYFAPDGGNISCVASKILTSGMDWISTSVSYTAHTTSSGNIIYDPLYLNLTWNVSIAVENFKLYNYAKLDFSDRNNQFEYRKKEKYNFIGLSDERKINYSTNILGKVNIIEANDKIYNKILINSITYSETYIKGNSTSADIYGTRIFEINNGYMALDNYSPGISTISKYIYDTYKDMKREVEFSAKFNPWINILDRVRFTYQTPAKQIADSFNNDFSDDFGDIARSYNYKEKLFSVIYAQHDIDKFESKFKLREV
jgi:hypothetical protein